MRQISISLIENFALLLVLAYIIGKLPLHIIGSRKFTVQLLIGALFGIVSVIAMVAPIDIYDGVVLDSRVIFIALAGPFGGYLAPVTAGLIAGLFYAYDGGSSALAEAIAICLPVLLGIILVKFPLKDDRRLRFSKLALCGILMGVLISPTVLLMPDGKMGLKLLQTSVLIMPFILMILFPITDAILNAQTWHLKVADELQQNEDTLKDAQKIGHFGNWEYDFKSKNITWSDELFRLMERDPSLGPMTIREIEERFPAETRDRFITNVAQAIKSGNTVQADYSLNLPSGRLVHHYVIIRPVKNVDGENIKLICTVQDITERKNAEENLRLTEAQRRALFKSIPVPINCWRQVGDDFELFEYNEASLIMTNGKIAEYLGVKHSVFNPARPDLVSDLKRCITLKETFTRENLNTTFSTGKKGDQILTFAFCPPNIAMIMMEDITDQKKNSRKLELSERRFRDFASTAADVLWETDENHRFVYFSSEFAGDFAPMVGLVRWDAEGIQTNDPKWDLHRGDLNAYRSFRDFRYSRTDIKGRRRYLRINGNPIFGEDADFQGYRGTTFDETDEVDARNAAKSAQEIFGEAMENVSEGIVLWDAQDRIIMRNSRFIEMFPDMAEIIDPDITFKIYNKIRTDLGYLLAEREDAKIPDDEKNNIAQSQNRVVEILAKDDRLYRVRQEVLANGRRIVFHTDITDEKHREEQLHQALKMEAVGQLTGGIAHDFNNILSAVLGNLELVLQKWAGDDNLVSRINRAKMSVLRGAELTRRLLAFSRKQNLNPKPARLNELVNGMHDLLERSLGEHVTIENSSENKLWPVMVDINMMENAVLNLSINARDAMPSGGILSLTCKNVDAAKMIELGVSEEDLGDCVCIEISDTGQGIPPEHLERVFEPFFTTKDVGRGSGLGLSMVYGLGLSMVYGFVSQSGGCVKIESVVEQGTKVSLFLPIFAGDLEDSGEAVLRQDLHMGRGEKVLVVEDDPDVRDMTLSLLVRLGYRPYDCGDGRRLFDMSAEEIQTFDMLLSDVVLPNGISGPMVAKHAREIAPDIKILLMTGYADRKALFGEDDKIQFEIINKPFRANELSSMLLEVLGD